MIGSVCSRFVFAEKVICVGVSGGKKKNAFWVGGCVIAGQSRYVDWSVGVWEGYGERQNDGWRSASGWIG